MSQERKSAQLHAGTPLNSSSIDQFRSLLTPQAWALHHESNTTSLVPVPALMRDWPALISAVLALFAIVPGALFSAGERSVHVPALNRAQYCIVMPYACITQIPALQFEHISHTTSSDCSMWPMLQVALFWVNFCVLGPERVFTSLQQLSHASV